MLCIRCNRDSKYPERQNRACPGCHGKFAFEPRENDPLTDQLFKKAVEAVSGLGQVRWGVENLYYEVCRRKRLKVPPVWVGMVLLFIVSVLIGVALSWPKAVPLWVLVVVLTVGAVSIFLKRPNAPYVVLTPNEFGKLWDRWCNVHGTPEGVIVRRDRPAPPPDAEPDLGDYSFDRAVLCDRARTVDLLLANNFHFENNCAILSIDGYPKGPFATVKAMLQRNPKLQVFVLHDATRDGCLLAGKVANDRDWFPEGTRIVDVGLRPGHAGNYFGVWQRSSGPVSVVPGLSEAEALWLSESRLELAAVRPQQVIRWLFRAINSQAAVGAPEADVVAGSAGVVELDSFG